MLYHSSQTALQMPCPPRRQHGLMSSSAVWVKRRASGCPQLWLPDRQMPCLLMSSLMKGWSRVGATPLKGWDGSGTLSTSACSSSNQIPRRRGCSAPASAVAVPGTQAGETSSALPAAPAADLDRTSCSAQPGAGWCSCSTLPAPVRRWDLMKGNTVGLLPSYSPNNLPNPGQRDDRLKVGWP